jgi:membrane-bound transcription factor site-1 protease
MIGTHIVRFPADGYLIYRPLSDQGETIMQMPVSPHMPQQRHLNFDVHENRGKQQIDIESIIKSRPISMPILGLVEASGGGRVAIYGDSNCIDSVHLVRDCYWLLLALLEFTTSSRVPKLFLQLDENRQMDIAVPELERLNTSRLYKFSRVIEKNNIDNTDRQRKLPQCLVNQPVKPSEPLGINPTSQK